MSRVDGPDAISYTIVPSFFLLRNLGATSLQRGYVRCHTHDPALVRLPVGPKTGKTKGQTSPKLLPIESDVNFLCAA